MWLAEPDMAPREAVDDLRSTKGIDSNGVALSARQTAVKSYPRGVKYFAIRLQQDQWRGVVCRTAAQ